MWTHTIREPIPARELLLAVTEPDETGTRYYIARVRHRHIDGTLCTEISYLPLPHIPAPRVIRDITCDGVGGLYVHPDDVDVDAGGVSRLARVHA